MKVWVDSERCQGHTLCAMIAPDSFQLSDIDGSSSAVNEIVPADQEDLVREAAYTVPFTINDPGPDRVTGTADDQQFQTQALAAGERNRLVQRLVAQDLEGSFRSHVCAVDAITSGSDPCHDSDYRAACRSAVDSPISLTS